MSFGGKVRELREARKMTESELARRAGMTRQQINNYERDANHPTLSSAIILADALDVSLDELAEREWPRKAVKPW